MAKVNETKVNISLQSVMLKPIAEPLAIPTCIVSLRSVIISCIRLLIQVGFKLSYVSFFYFVKFLHYSPADKKSLNVNSGPCFGISKFILL